MYHNLGLIGMPLEHTLSPYLHSSFFAQSGVNGGYCAFEVPEAGMLAETFAFFRRFHFRGVNVTVPYKLDVIPHCSRLDASAQLVGAVNTLVFTDTGTEGHNTDLFGFAKMLEAEGVDCSGRDVLVLGAGGAALAVFAWLAGQKGVRVTAANRSVEKAQNIVSRFGFSSAQATSLDILHESNSYDIIINTTSLGLSGEFPAPRVKARMAAVDLQYRIGITPFLAHYADTGCKLIDGFGMLVWQAYRAFSLWTGAEFTPDVKALKQHVVSR